MNKILTCYLKDVDTFNGRLKWLWQQKATLRIKKEEVLETLRTYVKQQLALQQARTKKRLRTISTNRSQGPELGMQ
ncbi:hypothetical protein [Priestia megaterium]|uniref:hypothetical protein n=1 Tax=Priestia megaterium TaxID=1404 RepID=UPI002E1FEB72|nr:hypothetical protein [Priestia megaterium]MED4279623.1 hypothetical protein [Priestia megaterium]MED4319203.1 hypothetical protein [Priestia megaterium]